MKKILALLLTLICVVGLASCNTTISNTDKSSKADNNPNVSGMELADEIVELEINPDVDSPQITENNLITNTTQITVTADSVKDDEEILLYLYNADDLDNPINYATLTEKNKSVDFTNLTSSCEYRIGATLKNSSKTVTLKITD